MPETLLEAVKRYAGARGGAGPFETVVPGLTIVRVERPGPPSQRLFKPSLCVVLQGAKWTAFGGQRLDYAAGQALVVSLELPSHGRVVEASPSRPFLGMVIELDPATMREVLGKLDHPPRPGGGVGAGGSAFITDFGGPLADGVRRLVSLLDQPEAIGVLYPAVMRELCYWLLTGPHGRDIARIVLGSGHDGGLLAALQALRRRFTKPVRVEELARTAHLSASAFHRQFKALTALTPLQYQKRLRLLEARNLLLAGTASAETAALRVGYASASQFSREYARLFGAPPRRDVNRVRASLQTATLVS